MKDQEEILKKLGIKALNEMQHEALDKVAANKEVVLLSPTGTGKTIAFLLPIIAELKSDDNRVQALIIAPSRELAVQIEQVMREMGSGFKANVVYGGRAAAEDRLDLQHPPAVLIGTPGRIADHLKKESFATDGIKTLVLDEFDKSLEIGFEEEMRTILNCLPALKKKILTSATQKVKIPGFVQLRRPVTINYLENGVVRLRYKIVPTPDKDKLSAFLHLLKHLNNQSGIVFCNFRESIEQVSDFLDDNEMNHSCFYGVMEQVDRERALVKFRNGTHCILLATDLAARGIDVPEIEYIIHYELPPKEDEFVHRNGRTARMNQEGTAYILKHRDAELPPFIEALNPDSIDAGNLPKAPSAKKAGWKTLYISGGRRDKISKGDIAGLFMKQGRLAPHQLGTIEIMPDHSFVAVQSDLVQQVLPLVNNMRLKKNKVRISELM